VVLFAAVFADSINLKSVAGREVVILAADFLLELADFLGKEFDRTAAVGADHVMMAAAIVLVLVAGDAVMEGDFAGQAALCQQFESAVDGGVADAGVFFLHQAVKFVGGEMVAGFEKGMQDYVALRGLLESDALQMAVQYFLGLADHLAGDGGLIIDALLQHGGWNIVRIPSEHLENEIHFQRAATLSRVEYNQSSP
jgi:hypothetical protein